MDIQLLNEVNAAAATLTPEELSARVPQDSTPAEFLEGTPETRSSITICSIYPAELSHTMLLGRGMKHFVLPAGSPEKPSYLKIYNSYMRTQNTQKMEGDDPDYIERPVPCRAIVHDLLVKWGGDHPGVIGTPGVLIAGGRCIGVFQCEGEKATKKELDLAYKNQVAMFTFVLERENTFWHNGKRDRNHMEARRALDWMGIRDYQNYPWYPVLTRGGVNKCPACAKDMSDQAFICGECRTNVAVHMLDRGMKVDQKVWPGVAAEVEFLNKARKELKNA